MPANTYTYVPRHKEPNTKRVSSNRRNLCDTITNSHPPLHLVPAFSRWAPQQKKLRIHQKTEPQPRDPDIWPQPILPLEPLVEKHMSRGLAMCFYCPNVGFDFCRWHLVTYQRCLVSARPRQRHSWRVGRKSDRRRMEKVKSHQIVLAPRSVRYVRPRQGFPKRNAFQQQCAANIHIVNFSTNPISPKTRRLLQCDSSLIQSAKSTLFFCRMDIFMTTQASRLRTVADTGKDCGGPLPLADKWYRVPGAQRRLTTPI